MGEIWDDPGLRFWYHLRFAPHYPPIYRTLPEVPVAVYAASIYLDQAYDATGEALD